MLRNNQLRVVLERGLQGMPKLPGMNPEIADNAHALALGKVVLALGPREAVDRYAQRRPQALHARDHHGARSALHEELRRVRLTGVASEREEFERDFCCLAAPVLDHERRFLGAVGISMSKRPSTTSASISRRRSATSSDSNDLPRSGPILITAHTPT